MVQESLSQKYRGVRCISCGQPIALSANIVTRERAVRGENADRSVDVFSSPFNLRCKACSKENFYRIAEIVDIEGAPRLLSQRSGAPSPLMRSRVALSRVANS